MFFTRVLHRQLIYVASFLAVLAGASLATKLEHMSGMPSSHRLGNVANTPFLLQLRNENGTFICAASLIAPQYALTAAECFKEIDFTKVSVVAGATTVWDVGAQRHISKISKYPKRHVNMAVLKLSAPLHGYKPIEMSDKPIEECDREGLVRLVGWRHLDRPRSTSKDLHTNELRIVAHNTCEMAFFMAETKKLFCLLGNRHEDQVCTADAGGPALCDGKLYGVVSKGHQCGYPDHIVSVTKVFDVLSFIEDEMI